MSCDKERKQEKVKGKNYRFAFSLKKKDNLGSELNKWKNKK